MGIFENLRNLVGSLNILNLILLFLITIATIVFVVVIINTTLNEYKKRAKVTVENLPPSSELEEDAGILAFKIMKKKPAVLTAKEKNTDSQTEVVDEGFIEDYIQQTNATKKSFNLPSIDTEGN